MQANGCKPTVWWLESAGGWNLMLAVSSPRSDGIFDTGLAGYFHVWKQVPNIHIFLSNILAIMTILIIF